MVLEDSIDSRNSSAMEMSIDNVLETIAEIRAFKAPYGDLLVAHVNYGADKAMECMDEAQVIADQYRTTGKGSFDAGFGWGFCRSFYYDEWSGTGK